MHIYIGGDSMRKVRIVTVKMTESDLSKLKAIAGDKSISECVRELIEQAYSGVKQDVRLLENFERIIPIMEQLSTQKTNIGDHIFARHFQAIMETLKILGNLIIALPDKRKIFTDEIERIEAKFRGDR
jgi:hypothetical protein